MSNRRIAVGAALVATVLTGALAASQLPANADGAPQVGDVVGVGSDVMQNSLNFLADGSPAHPGYNSAGNKNRLFSFDASGDANGRKPFTDPGLGTSGVLASTAILRAGTRPVQRPNGGGVGLTALLSDGDANRISFARSPNLPTAAQQVTAQKSIAAGGLNTKLHSVQIGTDVDYIATATDTNAPAVLTAADLTHIYNGDYTTWKQVPNYLDTHTATQGDEVIKPLIPQVGAGMRTIFLNGLKAANGGTTVSPGAGVTQVQQNDPTAITGAGLTDAERKNAIVPFPKGRYTLLNNGYFLNPDTVYSQALPAAPLTTTGIKLIDSGAGAFTIPFSYYVIFRQSDADSSVAWQPGGTLNWVQTLFSNPGTGKPAPFVNTGPGQSLLTDAGITPAYSDLGDATNG
ncbi:MAG: hypothetical protein ACJ72D_30425 [Marmoricola sp.]